MAGTPGGGRIVALLDKPSSGAIIRATGGSSPANRVSANMEVARSVLPRLLAAALSQPRDAYRYDPFGAEALAAGLDSNAFRFGGSYGATNEPAVPGLMKMGFRYYDSEAGRFISQDPLFSCR